MSEAELILAKALFTDVLSTAIEEVRKLGTPVYTFAFYHDHESAAVSVCVDTEANSLSSVMASNAYGMKYFAKAVETGNLKSAALWNANIGRSLSLGDFVLVNVARTKLDGIEPNNGFHLAMVRALWERQQQIAKLSPTPERLLFCCSGANDEVEFMWSLNAAASS